MKKQTVIQIVKAMPDDVDLDDLLNRLYVLDQVEEGERSLAQEGGMPDDEIRKRFGLIPK